MEVAEYHRLVKLEDSHWWYRSLHGLLLSRLTGYQCPGMSILDAGCGTGRFTAKLSQFGKVIGLDISPLALRLVKLKSNYFLRGSVNSLPFKSKQFELVTCISVLYHRRVNDTGAIAEIARVLKIKGRALIIMPAFSWAYSHHDDTVHTRRRYTLAEARQLVQSAGMRVVSSHYIYSFLFPLFILKRFLETVVVKTNQVSDLIMPHPVVNMIFESVCRLEWKLPQWARLPFGSSILLIASKGSYKSSMN